MTAISSPPQVIVATISSPDAMHGVQTHFCSFVDHLRSRHQPVALVTPQLRGAISRFALRASLKLLRITSGTLSVWWHDFVHYHLLRDRLRRELADGRACVVYAQCPLSAQAALAVRRGPQQQVGVIAHSGESQACEWAQNGLIAEGGPTYRRIQAREVEVFQQVDKIVYVSEFSRRALEQRIPALSAKPRFVAATFVADPLAGQGPTAGPTVAQRDLITIGRLEPLKNQQYILRVLAEARMRHGRRFTLTIVGDGPDRRSLTRMVHALGIGDQVVFSGWRPQAVELIPAHRAYCHASRVESAGLVLIEAMACGRPVIAAPVGGVPESFRDGMEGVFWDLADPVGGAAALIRLLDDEKRVRRLSGAGRARFESEFSAGSVIPRLHRFLTQERIATSDPGGFGTGSPQRIFARAD